VSRALAWSLVVGPVPAVIGTVGVACLVFLVAGRGRRWWLRRVPGVLAVAVALPLVMSVAVDRVWRPFPDSLPLWVLLWTGVGVAAVGLGVVRLRSAPWSRRVLVGGAVLLVLAFAAVEVNRFYGQYPTVGTALGFAPPGQVDLSQTGGPVGPVVAAPLGGRLAQVWRSPPGMPAHGVVSQVVIASPVSRFAARRGWVYLPPAYLTSPRALLPVLVLLAGQPGSPIDWLNGGRLATVLDGFAEQHGGLAPVVVIPDDLGRPLANPLCLDSRLGMVETYLSTDVPAWIRSNLQVDPDPRQWTIGGYSHGGTCALQLAVRAPEVYPTFIDISGQDEPTLGDRQTTVRAAYGGDHEAFRQVNPLDILATRRFPASAAMIVAGRQDAMYRPQQQRVLAACRAAGMDVDWLDLPGGHGWSVWGPGLQQSLPWLGARTGLTR